jgi:hypothetical protein
MTPRLTPRLLTVLNRRLDRVFLAMEIAWAVCQRQRGDATARCCYLAQRRRAARLWTTIKPFSQS